MVGGDMTVTVHHLHATENTFLVVDVRGDGLRNVIITRLPFESPDKPLAKARTERVQAEGGRDTSRRSHDPCAPR